MDVAMMTTGIYGIKSELDNSTEMRSIKGL